VDSPVNRSGGKKHFAQLLNVLEFNDVKHPAEPPAPEPNVFDSIMAVGKMKE